MKKTTQLLIKTDYSLLNSLIKIDNLIDFLIKNNIKTCGICDNNLSSSIEFYTKCIEKNIKPIIGLEISFLDNIIYLYAKNYDGYKNLLKLNTYKENIDKELLIKYSNNLVCVLPQKSYNSDNELTFYDDLYYGYENEEEKTCALIKGKSLFIKDIRCIDSKDLPYFKYLNLLGGQNKIDYDYSYVEIDSKDEKTIIDFCELINLNIPFNKRYIPKYKSDVDSSKFLNVLAHEGLKKRLNKEDPVYEKRLDYELKVINEMNFVDYFLIVYDYCLYAKKHGCLVGPGRGSAAGSLVCYSIGITDIDPIKYNLMFERFLNPARVTMPDIDIDFENTKRELVIDYVKEKYGKENVASGLTYNTLKTKLVLREICKLNKVDDSLTNKFIKAIDAKLNLKDNLKNEKVKKFLSLYKELEKVYSISMHLEGLKKNISTHAAGVVISSEKLDNIIPVIYENNNLLTGITMEYLENLGLLKMDFLGLKNLTIIANILNNLHKDVLKNIDLEDKKVLDLFKLGKTNGIFQYETYAMKNLLLKLKPTSFNDLVASVALVRPGPSNYLDEYIACKEHTKKINYLDPVLEPILKETYGIILYQEQIISILEHMGGFTKSEADIIRRAISKKKEEVILKSKEKFINGAIEKGIKKEIAIQVYDMIIKFSGYGFNKSHSVAYALIGYQMAFLKTYYPIYFINELLQDNKDIEQVSSYLTELKQNNIKIIKPDVNYSKQNFYIENNSLIMPLTQIKGITKELAKDIELNMPYKDYFDFVYKNKDIVNEKILNTLIKASALRSLKQTKATLINNIASALNYASLNVDDDNLKPILNTYPEYSFEKLLDMEIESYGFYVTNHPSSKFQDKSLFKIKDINENLFKNIKGIVVVENINSIKTKNKEDMAFLTISDETGKCEAVVFKDVYPKLRDIRKNSLVLIQGKVSKSFDKTRIIINNIVSNK